MIGFILEIDYDRTAHMTMQAAAVLRLAAGERCYRIPGIAMLVVG
jgi:hypothetical protein